MITQEVECICAQTIAPTLLIPDLESIRLFKKYQATVGGVPLNPSQIILCKCNDPEANVIHTGAKMNTHASTHEHGKQMKISVNLCGHNVGGNGSCSARLEPTKANNLHRSDQQEQS